MTTHRSGFHRSGLLLAVAVGSGIGAVARYLLYVLGYQIYPTLFPWPTLLINAAGSLLIGYCAAMTLPNARWAHNPLISHAVMVGFCGGFTTFSLFSLEIWLLAQNSLTWAFVYAALSWASWLGACTLGFTVGRKAI